MFLHLDALHFLAQTFMMGRKKMKRFERILIKIIIIQFFILILSQFVFHKFQVLPEMNQLARYEGVTENNFSQFLETFNGQ